MTDLSRETIDSSFLSADKFAEAWNEQNHFSDDFLQGQRDCRNGKEHLPGRSKAYDRGYAAQYKAEQIASEKMRGEL